MVLTVNSCYQHIQHTLGGEPAPEVSMLGILNQAGSHWSAMRTWKCLERPSVRLSLVAAQGYITLPSDFGEFIATPMTNVSSQANGMLRFGTHQEVVERQAWAPTGDPAWFSACMTYTTAGSPVLEVGPVPINSYSNIFTTAYRAGWTQIVDDNSTLTIIPPFMEPLFLNIVRAFARGYEEEDEGSLTDRLNKIQQGAIYAAAVQFDSRTQPDLGPLRGGGASFYYDGYSGFPSNITVPAP